MFPLSSARKGVTDPAQDACPSYLSNTCWRSEAFAEDLPSEQLPGTSKAGGCLNWPSVLQSVLPLSVALVGGVLAMLDALI